MPIRPVPSTDSWRARSTALRRSRKAGATDFMRAARLPRLLLSYTNGSQGPVALRIRRQAANNMPHMPREKAARLGRETVAILREGRYVSSGGVQVDISA